MSMTDDANTYGHCLCKQITGSRDCVRVLTDRKVPCDGMDIPLVRRGGSRY